MAPPGDSLRQTILSSLHRIYSERDLDDLARYADVIFERLNKKSVSNSQNQEGWNQKTSVLITYGDSIQLKDQKPLDALLNFYHQYLSDIFDVIHILPFFPSGGDDGFSVISYEDVDASLGTWHNISAISKSCRIMGDLVINHGSRKSEWFQQFLEDKSPGNRFFFTIDDGFDTAQVVRPRDHTLIQKITTKGGEQSIWCTFSEDQVDYDFKNPDVLMYFINTVLDFIDRGVSIIRLDAVGFLWKESGSSCLNLDQTHAIIKLIRLICEQYSSHTVIVTETNLPNQENLSYFGNGNEAHWIYNFPLPPLILHTLLQGNSDVLRRWSMSMPPALHGTAYLNFLSSHDGFGLRPIEGILSDEEKQSLITRLEKNGSLFTWRSSDDDTKKIYEANVTLFSALKMTDDDEAGQHAIDRFIAAHAIMMSLEGIPAVYINSLIGCENDLRAVEETGIKRRINREKFEKQVIDELLEDNGSQQAIVMRTIKQILSIRSKQPAFHPNATQFTLQLGQSLFGVWRQSIDREQSIFAITNVTSNSIDLNIQDLNLIDIETWYDIQDGSSISETSELINFKPYQSVWISNKMF